ncbi:MAG TPA: hypothetical protein VFW71_03245 [Actinomycetota bacterium]|nr:hypothetical protein [Actinomycetota bacterium]
MDQDGWVGIVAGELMVQPQRVQKLAAAVREVGIRVTPADLIGAGARAALVRDMVADRPAPGATPTPELRPIWERLRSW